MSFFAVCTGPYSNDITVLTNEDGKIYSLYVYNTKYLTVSYNFCFVVPGVVSDLAGQPKFTSIVLTWSAPQEPNGVIISYEVTYRASDGNLVTTNTTDLRFTIPSLTPSTNVTEISVSAYTSVGRGNSVQIPHLVTLIAPREYTCTDSWPITILMIVAKVMIMLEVVSATSIQVSWDRLYFPEITGYIVYYSQKGNSESATIVPSSMNSVTIDNLLTDVEYQFQVVAVAELDEDVVMGERSNVYLSHLTPEPLPATTPASPAATEGQCESTLDDNTST